MSAAKTKDEGERPQRRAWLGDEVDRLITWMRARFADARLDDGAGEAAAVIRFLERERARLAHEANRQALRRTVRRGRSKRFSGEVL
jgi:hypothetical protein